MPATPHSRFAVILPACNEEACIGAVLAELRAVLDPARFVFAVGVNDSRDRTACIAREAGAFVGETNARGYGHGCQAAIEEVGRQGCAVDGYVFFAADGANDPRDIALLLAGFDEGAAMVLGSRTGRAANAGAMGGHYILANRIFGLAVGCLTGRMFRDLGPLRLIGRELFHALQLREWTYGWTIEAQVGAVMLGAKIVEVEVSERPRLAGEQKVGRVSWWRTLAIGLRIIAAGVRSRVAFASRAAQRSAGAALAGAARS